MDLQGPEKFYLFIILIAVSVQIYPLIILLCLNTLKNPGLLLDIVLILIFDSLKYVLY